MGGRRWRRDRQNNCKYIIWTNNPFIKYIDPERRYYYLQFSDKGQPVLSYPICKLWLVVCTAGCKLEGGRHDEYEYQLTCIPRLASEVKDCFASSINIREFIAGSYNTVFTPTAGRGRFIRSADESKTRLGEAPPSIVFTDCISVIY